MAIENGRKAGFRACPGTALWLAAVVVMLLSLPAPAQKAGTDKSTGPPAHQGEPIDETGAKLIFPRREIPRKIEVQEQKPLAVTKAPVQWGTVAGLGVLTVVLVYGCMFPRPHNLIAALAKKPPWVRIHDEHIGPWPTLWERNDSIMIRARHRSPQGMKDRYGQGIGAGLVAGLILFAAIYFHAKQEFQTQGAERIWVLLFLSGIGGALGAKFFPLLKHIRSVTAITLTPETIRTNRAWLRQTIPLQPGRQYRVDTHTKAGWEIQKQRRRAEKLRREGKEDRSEKPFELREVYQLSRQVFINVPGRQQWPLADVYFDENLADMLRNAVEAIDRRVMAKAAGDSASGQRGPHGARPNEGWEQRRRQEERQHEETRRRQEEERRRRDEQRRKHEEERQKQEQQRGAGSGWMPFETAFEIFEMQGDFTQAQLKTRYRELQQKAHPDHGGSTFFAKQVEEAYKIILQYKGWKK